MQLSLLTRPLYLTTPTDPVAKSFEFVLIFKMQIIFRGFKFWVHPKTVNTDKALAYISAIF
tara:strand:- start:11903 stop:12085 length:183 start_codon:yes stop_codon:yes gene_type:complete